MSNRFLVVVATTLCVSYSVLATTTTTAPNTTTTATATTTTTTTTPAPTIVCNTTLFQQLNGSVYIIPAAAEELQPTFYRVPAHQQERNYTCGPASVFAALSAFGLNTVSTTEANIAAYMNTSWEIGTYADAMVEGAQHFGLTAQAKNMMTFHDVQRALWEGSLVVVCYELCRDNDSIPWPLSYDNGHYSVVYGLDAANIYLMDPWSGHFGWVPRARWLTQWHCGGDLSRDGSTILQRWGMTVRAQSSAFLAESISITAQPPVFEVTTCPGDI